MKTVFTAYILQIKWLETTLQTVTIFIKYKHVHSVYVQSWAYKVSPYNSDIQNGILILTVDFIQHTFIWYIEAAFTNSCKIHISNK